MDYVRLCRFVFVIDWSQDLEHDHGVKDNVGAARHRSAETKTSG